MPELRAITEIYRPAASRPDPLAADLKPFKPYTYRGQGYDIFEEGDEMAMIKRPDMPVGVSEVPDGCTCTWSWGPPSFRWVRIGVKEDCPWHAPGDALMARLTGKRP